MGILATVKLATGHMQYMGLLGSLSLPYPAEFFNWISIPNLVNFDPAVLFTLVPELGDIDQRTIFIVVAVGIPLFLMVLTALVFFTLNAILTIGCGGLGFVILLATVLTKYVPGVVPDDIQAPARSREFWIMGAVMLAIPVLCKMRLYRRAKIFTPLMLLDELLPVACVFGGAVCSGFDGITRAIFMGVCGLYMSLRIFQMKPKVPIMVIGILIVLGGIGVTIWRYNTWSVPMPPQFYVPGLIIVVIGLCDFVSSVTPSSYDENGNPGFISRVWRSIKHLLDSGLLALALFFVQQAFVPVVTNCLDMFLCADYSCPLGTKFDPRRERAENDYTTSPEFFCDPCDFVGTCNLNATELCPPFASRRLLKYPEIPCDDRGFLLFTIAAGIVLFVFAIVIVAMFYVVIQKCTTRISQIQEGPPPLQVVEMKALQKPSLSKGLNDDEEFLLGDPAFKDPDAPKEPPKPYDPHEAWADAVDKAQPKASSLYQDYKYTYRYFSLIDLVYKVIIVFANVVVAPYSDVASVMNMVVHLLMTIMIVAFRPFIDAKNSIFAIITGFCDFFMSAYTVAIWQAPAYASSGWLAISVLVLGGLLPLVIGVVMIIQAVPERWELYKKKRERQEVMAAKMSKDLAEARKKALADYENQEMSKDNADPEQVQKEWKKLEKKFIEKFKKEYARPPEDVAVEELDSTTKSTILRFFAFVSIPFLLVAMTITVFAATKADKKQFVDSSSMLDRSKDAVLNGYDSWTEFSDNCCCFMPTQPQKGFNITERWTCRGPFIPDPTTTVATFAPPPTTTFRFTTVRVTTSRTTSTAPTTTSMATTTGTTTTTSTSAATVSMVNVTFPPPSTRAPLGPGVYSRGRTLDRGRRLVNLKDNGLPFRDVCGRSLESLCNVTIVNNETVELQCPDTWLKANNVTYRAQWTLW